MATDYLIDFMQQHKEQPFLAYYPMILPHNPFVPTPDSKDRKSKDQKQNFIDMVQYLDVCVGRIEDALVEMGIREKTLIVFTGDNGTNYAITSAWGDGQIRGAKGFTRDHGTHVPLIANLPGQIPAGQINDDLICFSDFFSTLVEAAGLPAKEISNGDGWSFWPQCQGHPGRKRDTIYGYYFPRPYSKKYNNMYSHFEVRYARDTRYKLYHDGRFFDTVDDVLENKPLKSREELQTIRAKLQAVLDGYPASGANIDYERIATIQAAQKPTEKKPGKSKRTNGAKTKEQ